MGKVIIITLVWTCFLFPDYHPHICGSGRYPSDECWRYLPSNDSWVMTAKGSFTYEVRNI